MTEMQRVSDDIRQRRWNWITYVTTKEMDDNQVYFIFQALKAMGNCKLP